MPITSAAKKALKQSRVKQARNYNTRTKYKRAMRDVVDAVKAGKVDEAVKALPRAQKEIDMATKKKVLDKKTAARRKSLLARTIAKAGK